MRNIGPLLTLPRPVHTASQRALGIYHAELCSFCEELHNASKVTLPLVKAFFDEFGQSSRILLSTDQFFVVPSIGALIPGHVLILPRAHYFSTAEMPDSKLREFEALVRKSSEIISDAYGTCSAFEHGCVEGVGKAGACIDHAHLHLLPLKKDLRPGIETRFGVGVPIHQLFDLKRFFASGTPYLYYEAPNGSGRGFEATIAPSQFFRQLVSASTGDIPNWDWKADLRVQVVRETYDSLLTPFQDLQKKFNERS